MAPPFTRPSMRPFLIAYGALWTILLPAVLIYLWWRGRRDPLYARHLGERFGGYSKGLSNAVWVHAVSLGEMRAAAPLIRALLEQGERVVTTHFTPTGRREAERLFARIAAEGTFRAVWVPFEFDWCYRRFFRAFRPKYGLVIEVEIWPRMIASSRRRGVALFMCNAIYPQQSFTRDRDRFPIRAALMSGFAGAMVKSDLQARRFAEVGVKNIAVTGELRSDQPVPLEQVEAGIAARRWLGADERPTVAFASVVAGEDEIFISALKSSMAANRAAARPAPLFIYVPRAPERFAEVRAMLVAEGVSVASRSEVFGHGLEATGMPPRIDVLLGDSMGEMYFYLAMADRVVVGGGFTANGSHNISEALALAKPVVTGPNVETIEYPAAEAIAAGVLLRLASPEALAAALLPDDKSAVYEAEVRAFAVAHSGAVARTLAAIPRLLAATSR